MRGWAGIHWRYPRHRRKCEGCTLKGQQAALSSRCEHNGEAISGTEEALRFAISIFPGQLCRLVLACAVGGLVLTGCAAIRDLDLGIDFGGGVHLYDATKAKLAKEAKETFQSAKVEAVVDQSLSNLDALLEKELEVVRGEFELRLDRALLQIAADDRPIATWYAARAKEYDAIGFGNGFGTRKLDAFLQDMDAAEEAAKEMAFVARFMDRVVPRVKVPLCENGMPAPEKWDVGTITKDKKKQSQLKAIYQDYHELCQEKLKEGVPLPEGGAAGQALADAVAAAVVLEVATREADEFERNVKDKRKAYLTAKKTAEDNPTAKTLNEVKEKAKELSKALEEAASAAEGLGLEALPSTYMKQIGVVLAAVASGKVDEEAVAENPDLKNAALILSGLPSLAADAIALAEAGDKPTVTNLLIELNHQRILKDRARELSTLAEREKELHMAKFAALVAQASALRQVKFHLCNLAAYAAGEPTHVGDRCEGFSLQVADGSACRLEHTTIDKKTKKETYSPIDIPNCILKEHWSTLLADRSPDPRLRRELYAAVLAYAQALDAQVKAVEADFRVIDVVHRRTATNNRAAIEAWNNLIGAPLVQLAAYHESGIKPDALAQAIASLLGLTGIAIGAAQ